MYTDARGCPFSTSNSDAGAAKAVVLHPSQIPVSISVSDLILLPTPRIRAACQRECVTPAGKLLLVASGDTLRPRGASHPPWTGGGSAPLLRHQPSVGVVHHHLAAHPFHMPVRIGHVHAA